MVTGGLVSGSVVEDNTEIYQDNAWRTASQLPHNGLVWAGSAITLNNMVLHVGNDKHEYNSVLHVHNRNGFRIYCIFFIQVDIRLMI